MSAKLTPGVSSVTIGSVVRSAAVLLLLGLAFVPVVATSASARNPNQEKIRFNAADQAAARAATVNRADLQPAGRWSGGMRRPDLSSASPTCPNYHPNLSRFVLTGAAESDWLRSGAALKSNVNVQTDVLQTAQMLRREWHLQVQDPAALPCLRSFLAKTYAAGGARLISLRRIPFPQVATYAAAYRVVGEVLSLRFVAEIALIAKSRTEITLSVFGPSSEQKWVAAQTLRLARILVGRIRA